MKVIYIVSTKEPSRVLDAMFPLLDISHLAKDHDHVALLDTFEAIKTSRDFRALVENGERAFQKNNIIFLGAKTKKSLPIAMLVAMSIANATKADIRYSSNFFKKGKSNG